ncbi:peptidoglycan DD-metalloendopeptidase family protein [Aliiglaciecola sp. CAU 1673]|uniref:peptidoglycan DD-metalloendopeptidase family protein n=1 Tax=Aliiglaciecola sp. CAU 1673 TaxID=3032595 RepID=UPI0023DC3974|nr:peptidoglycan DD-metalloendopeptidase family protein [Aliiglaciecola sp. CAU 1673]MDF2178970.1 peptidoglycan DD-metalloendopeptidase family protein [Aliiglaciecola sp. CAU 1673]
MITPLVLASCSSPNAPAPVVELSNPKSFKQFRQQGGHATYTVKKGDTLFSIAWYAGKDYQEVARINGIKAPYRIYPGQQIQLGSASKKNTKSSSKDTGQTSKTKANQPVDPPTKQAYGNSKLVKKTTSENASVVMPADVDTWIWPAKGKIVGRFSLAEEGNKGIDIANARGTPILASAAGKVVYTGSALRGFGQLVIIKHSDDYLSAYAHNDKILVKEQDWVKGGQQIALMGDSDAKQVMLHFEVRYQGKSVDPQRFLPKI